MKNKINLMGYVMVDSVLTERDGKIPYAKYPISVQTGRKVDGKYETIVYDITAFGTEAYWASDYAKKGARVVLEGQLNITLKQDGTPRKNPQVIVSNEGQSLRLKPSKIYYRNLNNNLSGDVPDTTQGDNYNFDPSYEDDDEIPF